MSNHSQEKRKMDSIQTPSVVTKIFSVANKLAPIAGVVHGMLGDPMADGRGIAGAPQFIIDRLAGEKGLLTGHIGNPLVTTQIALGFPDRYPIVTGIVSAIGGWIGEKIGDSVDAGAPGAVIKGFGKFMKNYGIAAAATSVVAGWLYLTPFNPGASGTEGTGGFTQATGYSQGVHKGGAGATNAIWQVRGAAQIRNSTGPVDIYPT
jgi:hypothetical protein